MTIAVNAVASNSGLIQVVLDVFYLQVLKGPLPGLAPML